MHEKLQHPDKPRLINFGVIWFGQVVSILGSGLTNFAIGVWVYQKTGSITQFAMISVFTSLPAVILAPFAGVLVDRFDRRHIMLLGDLGSALCTLSFVFLFQFGAVQIWYIYIIVTLSMVCNIFQSLAYQASIPLLIPKKHIGRANGMRQLGTALGEILAPAIASVLMALIGIKWVIFIDFLSCLFAVATLYFSRIPSAEKRMDAAVQKKSLFKDINIGWKYLAARLGLLGIVVLFAIGNIVEGMVTVLITPLILAVNSTKTLGSVMTVGGLGLLAGSVLMSTWGGPKRKTNGLYIFLIVNSIAILLGGAQSSYILFTITLFLYLFSLPMINGCAVSIMNSKVELQLQGRVFSVMRMVAKSSLPVSYLLSGPLADFFERLIRERNPLVEGVSRIIGAGPGRGIGLLFIILGCFQLIIVFLFCLYPRLRFLEDELPDVIPD